MNKEQIEKAISICLDRGYSENQMVKYIGMRSIVTELNYDFEAIKKIINHGRNYRYYKKEKQFKELIDEMLLEVD